MKKEPFVTKEQIEEIVKTYPTPFHHKGETGLDMSLQFLQSVLLSQMVLSS